TFKGADDFLLPVVFVLVLVLIISVISLPFIKKKVLNKTRQSKLAELESLEKRAQRMYFREKSISKAEYSKLMADYDLRKRGL
ncbi:MAG: hypothetical protein COV47_05660, partial [Candidatus Diapherotrites archaeon CG11_big_fil_rev_8_21_14_0_20_37_9]